ncbi:MAG: DUF2141 domain-containing protein [Hyphomicrobiales bacterium]|nr:DUF2141 domain-containing protein [Hyphomicrobiales bacterium]
MTKGHATPASARKRSLPPLGAIFTAVALSGSAFATDIDLEIRGFADDAGVAVVRLYASQAAYEADAADELFLTRITARTADLRIPDLNGTYALVVHHDRDGNGMLNTLPLGVSLEPVGYSRGAWNVVSRPDWALASFSSDTRPSRQLIELRTNALVAFAQMLAVGLPTLLAVFLGLAVVRRVRTHVTGHAPGKGNLHD